MGQYKMTQKTLKKVKKPWHMGTHLRKLSEGYMKIPIWKGLDGFQKSLRPCVWTKVVSALKQLTEGATSLPGENQQLN